ILLPHAPDGLARLEKQLTEDNLERWRGQLEQQEVTVLLPKLEVKTGFELSGVFKAMGMGLPFSPKADFSEMSKEDKLVLSEVVHQTALQVNEEGTVAAAGTSSVVVGRTMPSVFKADHPFTFCLSHAPTRAILSLGRVGAPSSWTPPAGGGWASSDGFGLSLFPGSAPWSQQTKAILTRHFLIPAFGARTVCPVVVQVTI